jgi:hypothetical protein
MPSTFKKLTATLLFTLPCTAFAAESSVTVTPTLDVIADVTAEPATELKNTELKNTVSATQKAPAIDVENLSPQQQAQALMAKLVPFAAENIAEFGEFYPFGAGVNAQGDIMSVAGHKGNDFVEQQNALDNIFLEFQQGITDNGLILTAVFSNQLIQSPDKKIPVQAIVIRLDHKEGFSRVVYLPYMKTEQGVQYGKMMMDAGKGEVFFGK